MRPTPSSSRVAPARATLLLALGLVLVGPRSATATDLRLFISLAAQTFEVNEDVVVTLVADNKSTFGGGPFDATGVVVKSTLPGAFGIFSATPQQGSCTITGQTVECNLGTVNAHAEASVQIAIRANEVGSFAISANATSTLFDPNPNNNNASTTVNIVEPPPALSRDDAANLIIDRIGDVCPDPAAAQAFVPSSPLGMGYMVQSYEMSEFAATLPRKAWFGWIDCFPAARFEHDGAFVFIDADGEQPVELAVESDFTISIGSSNVGSGFRINWWPLINGDPYLAGPIDRISTEDRIFGTPLPEPVLDPPDSAIFEEAEPTVRERVIAVLVSGSGNDEEEQKTFNLDLQFVKGNLMREKLGPRLSEEQIIVLENPTLEALESMFISLEDQYDTIYFYYSGHGRGSRDEEGSPQPAGVRVRNGRLVYDELALRLYLSSAENLNVILDVCRAGSAEGSFRKYESLLARTNLTLIAASSSTKSSYSSIDPGWAGEFSRHFLLAFGDPRAESDGIDGISLEEAFWWMVSQNPSTSFGTIMNVMAPQIFVHRVPEKVSVKIDPEERTAVAGTTITLDVTAGNNSDEGQPIRMVFSISGSSLNLAGAYLNDASLPLDLATEQFVLDDTLPVGESAAVTLVADALEPGDGMVCVTSTGVLEGSFCATVTVLPEAALPDLYIIAQSVTDAGGRGDPYVGPGEEYVVEVQVGNIGLAPSLDSHLNFWFGQTNLMERPDGCTDVPGDFTLSMLDCPGVGPLGVGERRVYTFRFRALDSPTEPPYLVNHTAKIIPVDPELDENEFNHYSGALIQVGHVPFATATFVPEQAVLNERFPVRVSVENLTDRDAADITMDVSIPGDCSVVDFFGDGQAEASETGVFFDLMELLSAASAEWLITLVCSETGAHEVGIFVRQADKDLLDIAVLVEVVAVPACSVTKSVPFDSTPAVGSAFRYLVTVASTVDREQVILRDPFPAGLRVPLDVFGKHAPPPADCNYVRDETGLFVRGLQCTFPLEANVPREVTIEAEAVHAGVITNIVEACGLAATETIDAQDLAVEVSIPQPIEIGSYFSIRTTVTNIGTEEAPDVELELRQFPGFRADLGVHPGVRFRSSTRCSLDDAAASCLLGTLGPGESVDVTVIAHAYGELNDGLLGALATSLDGRRRNHVERYDVMTRNAIISIANLRFGGAGKHTNAAVDVYLDGRLVAGALDPGSATSFESLLLSRSAPRVEVREAGATATSEPLAFLTADLSGTEDDSVPFSERTILLLTDTPGDTLGLVVRRSARTEAETPGSAEVSFAHASPDQPEVTLHLAGSSEELTSLGFGESTPYVALEPTLHRVTVHDASTGERLNSYSFALEAHAGEAVLLVLAGRRNDGTLTLHSIDGAGTTIPTPIQREEAIPAHFVLHGNYPNPFNPSTTVHFDLPEAVSVRLEVFDVLGRRVLEVPARLFDAGSSQRMAVDGGTLASGAYLYRLIAKGALQTYQAAGRFVLVK